MINSATSRIPGLVAGTRRLLLALPEAGQSLFKGYPVSVSAPYGVLFTDSPASPSTAQIALLLPTSEAMEGAANYIVLMGSYVRGLDAMQWELFVPEAGHDAKATLRPATGILPDGHLIFRRR